MTQLNFLYPQPQLQDIADSIIKKSVQLGAAAAQVELSEVISTDVEVLNSQIDNFETSQETQLLLTVYKGKKKGSIAVSNILPRNLDAVIQQALDIAKYTEEDPANGLLEKEYLANEIGNDLELFYPYLIDNRNLINQAKYIEELALNQHSLVTASDGAAISLTQYNFVIAASNGFNLGYQTSRYSNQISLIGESNCGMQTDYWYSSARNYSDLASPESLAQTAADRVARRLISGGFKSEATPVILESAVAKSLISSLISALSGSSLYRKLSFLNDSLDTKIMPEWLNIIEDPFIVRGLASCHFDNEGSRVAKRHIIQNGAVKGYVLSSYSARRMNMKPTGNSGGTHNLEVTSNFTGNLDDLAKEMYNGIIIVETIGHGLNMVTGDYSVGASGLVVISGRISHFVDNLTISGNLRKIFANIGLIANDSEKNSLICGSILINEGAIKVTSK